MEAVTRLHGLAGPALLAALAALTVGTAALALLRRGPDPWAEVARRIVLALVVVEAVVGVVLVLRGAAPAESIHWLYGVAIVLVLLAPAALEPRAGSRSSVAILPIALGLATLFAWRLLGERLMRRGALFACLLGVAGAMSTLLGSAALGQDASDEASAERGEALYRAGCATCHGDDGQGVDGWPAIDSAGAAAADFQLRTGRMPFTSEPGTQAQPKPPAYDEAAIRDLVAYVATLGDGPAIPEVRTDPALLARGNDLFAVNCAPCHGATGNGGAVGGGAVAWPLTDDGPLTVAEAMVTGPGQMPVFRLPQDDIDAVATYVDFLRTQENPGGFAIGGIGPVPEGLVAWLVGMGLLLVVVVLVGRTWDRAGGAR